MAAYYPRRVVRFQDLQKAYPGFETFDDDEEDRVEHVQISKSRGKGAPKKKRTAAGECLRKRRWERMRKRRKARLRKTNRWIVRGHGDEQEDQEEGDVSENRMLTFRDPQNQRSSARRRGKRFAPSGPLYLLFLPLQPQARQKLVQIHITHWRCKQRKRAWDHGFCHITKGRSWEFNGYQAYIKPSKESGKYFFSTEKLQVVQKDFKTHLPITFKLCLFGTSNVCRESAVKRQ